MKNVVVEVPTIITPITESPGFEKKDLASYKLDILALCGFGCLYCSSNCGNYLRIRQEPFADFAEEQTGARMMPCSHPEVTYTWPAIIAHLESQLAQKRPGFGSGHTLVFSMLTDGFSPLQVADGTTERALRLVLEQTEFRIRVLTKNSIVGSPKWVSFFREHADRFVVGLSTGTASDQWAGRVELGTSSPTARLRALRTLQDAGVPTFGMLCPVFPDVLDGDGLERLLDAVRPQKAETVWAEPYNDRANWGAVQSGYDAGSAGYRWLQRVYGDGNKDLWSEYARDLYVRLQAHAHANGWTGKLKYLLYEGKITAAGAHAFTGLQGVLLQSRPDDAGRSKNPHIAALQSATGRAGGAP